jgi:hypothetical protein
VLFLIAELKKDGADTRAIRDRGRIEGFLAML